MTLPRRVLDRLRRSPAEVAWVVAGQCVAALCALVGVRYLTQFLAPSEYGVLALSLTVGALMQQLVFGPVSSAVLRFYSASEERGELMGMLRAAASLIGWATLALMLLAIASALVPALPLGGVSGAVIVIACVFACVSGLNGALAAAHSAARRRSVVAAHQALSEVLRFSLAIAAIRLVNPSSMSALMGFVAGVSVCAVSQAVLLARAVPAPASVARDAALSRAHWHGQLVQYAIPFAVWGSFTWTVLAADRWSLQAFHSTDDVGRYAALFQLGSYPITMGATMMVQLVAPILFSRASDGSDPARLGHTRRLNRQLTALVLVATVVATVLAALLHRQVFSLLVGPAYRSLSFLLPLVVLGAGLFAAGQQLALTLLSDLRANRLIGPKIGSALVGIGCYYAGARWWGITGVVVAGIAFGVIHLVWIAIASRGATEQAVSSPTVTADAQPAPVP